MAWGFLSLRSGKTSLCSLGRCLSAFPSLSPPGQAALFEVLVCPSPSVGDRQARHLPGQQLLCRFSLGPKMPRPRRQRKSCLPLKRGSPFLFRLSGSGRSHWGLKDLLCELDAAVGQRQAGGVPSDRTLRRDRLGLGRGGGREDAGEAWVTQL